ncbi:MAG: endonuclease/exonuclease/phosphatase family protein [Candidatus Melainabacteria bacterium]|nr:endonuclease/exonuclease/phosphatase family protein [Candidatus Melainabacteria bacterium]
MLGLIFLPYKIFLVFTALGLMVLSLSPWLGEKYRTFDVLSNFVPFWLSGLVVVLPFLIVFKLRVTAFLSVLCLLFVAGNFTGYIFPDLAVKAKRSALQSGGKNPTNTLKLMAVNLWSSHNRDPEKIFGLIEKEKPAIIEVCEIEDSWERRLTERLSSEYPHRSIFAKKGGMAVFSKYPILRSQIKYARDGFRPRMVVDLKVGGGPLSILACHPYVPISSVGRFSIRNDEFKIYADEVQDRRARTILVGDLNCTAWSHYFQKMLREAKLTDTACGARLKPTWPQIPNPLLNIKPMITIDHCLITKDIKLVERKTLPDCGSDHRPICVELAI